MGNGIIGGLTANFSHFWRTAPKSHDKSPFFYTIFPYFALDWSMFCSYLFFLP